MGPLGLEADEADFNINLPTMDDRSSCLGTIRSSADPGVRFLPTAERNSAACRWLAIRARASWTGIRPAGRDPARASGSLGSGFVLLNDARGDAPALANRDALVFRPRPDIATALPA